MRLLKLILLAVVLTVFNNVNAQKKYKIHTIAFYNLENLFDTENDPDKFDEASPMMELKTNKD